jgi:hypothetical protein
MTDSWDFPVSGWLHAPATSPPRKLYGTHWKRDWMGLWASLNAVDKRKLFSLMEFESRQTCLYPVDWTISAPPQNIQRRIIGWSLRSQSVVSVVEQGDLLDSYSRGTPFESWPGHRLYRGFSCFPQFPRQFPGWHLHSVTAGSIFHSPVIASLDAACSL